MPDRLFHWLQAACMFVLLATALLPVLGIQFSWVMPHWIAGLVLTATVAVHIVRATFWQGLGSMWIGWRDLRDMPALAAAVLKGQQGPKPGKYTLAQKSFHAVISLVILLAVATGIVLMFGVETPFWERDPYTLSESMRGAVFVLHGLTALVSVTLIMLHIYFAVRPEKLFYTRSMILGWISRQERDDHHDATRWTEN